VRTNLDAGWWEIEEGESPLIAVALHAGHALCPSVEGDIALPPAERLREEDPFTDFWTTVSPTRIIVNHSRFGLDLNRPREKAIYLLPEDAWGLKVWRDFPAEEWIRRGADRYDAFYRGVERVIEKTIARHGCFVVFDFHSYNHRRSGPNDAFDSPDLNPEINLGTASVNRDRWSRVLDRFLLSARSHSLNGRILDVRENIRFFGGAFPRWVNDRFGESGCALAIEVKKIFMDEWTAEPNLPMLDQLRGFLASVAKDVIDELEEKRNGND
jgi:N-formylglutamate deformylase